MRPRWWIALTGLALGITGCAAPLTSHNLEAGRTLRCRLDDFRFNGAARTYRLHIPKGYRAEHPHPLVVVIHGAFSTAKEMERLSGFSRLADREGFIALYPDGIGLFGFLQHWNAGHCCGKAAADQVDDIGFIWSAVEDAASRLTVDWSRVYVAGFSNGGMLTHRIGAEISDKIAAIAPIAGAIGGKASPDRPLWRIPAPGAPLAVIIMHGIKDPKVPYGGGPVDGKPGQREYLSVDEAVDFWARHNRCQTRGELRTSHDDSLDIRTWTDCADAVQVQCHAFRDVAHTWPEAAVPVPVAGQPEVGFDAAETIWRFFQNFSR